MTAAFLFALFFVLLTTPGLIRLRLGQPIREEGPRSHRQKEGTPTFGGLAILGALLFGSLLFDLALELWPLMVTLILFGALGFYDDWVKVRRGAGLSIRTKFLLQLLAALLVAILLDLHLEEHAYKIPWSRASLSLGLGFLPLTALVIVGTSNAVNLTDGLDGLAAVPIALVAGALGLIASWSGMAELTLFCALMAGGTLGFLWFNAHPAQIFMGDTGSLTLGALMAVVAVLLRQELLLPLLGGLFVLETLSVILQVVSFKKSGKRIFRMAPLHHHFELGGWPECRVVVRFWLLALLSVTIGLAGAA